jgi:hypothetical protein
MTAGRHGCSCGPWPQLLVRRWERGSPGRHPGIGSSLSTRGCQDVLVKHLSTAELEAGLSCVRDSPSDGGALVLIARRPAVDEREVLSEATLDVEAGLAGDTWPMRASSCGRLLVRCSARWKADFCSISPLALFRRVRTGPAFRRCRCFGSQFDSRPSAVRTISTVQAI